MLTDRTAAAVKHACRLQMWPPAATITSPPEAWLLRTFYLFPFPVFEASILELRQPAYAADWPAGSIILHSNDISTELIARLAS